VIGAADTFSVKGLDKLTPIRLAEVLTQKGTIDTEAITEALYSYDKVREPFPDTIVGAGHITEWDLAKLVVEHFQLPFIMASNYEITDTTRKRLPKEILFEHVLVPLDMFGSLMTVVMPILTPFEALDKIQREHQVTIFPYVGLPSENKTVLSHLFPDFADWYKKFQEELTRKKKQRAATKGPGGGDDWMNLFDSGDAAVKRAKA
jgi:hypothetical protein